MALLGYKPEGKWKQENRGGKKKTRKLLLLTLNVGEKRNKWQGGFDRLGEDLEIPKLQEAGENGT